MGGNNMDPRNTHSQQGNSYDRVIRAKLLKFLENQTAGEGPQGLDKYTWSQSAEAGGVEYHQYLNETQAIIMKLENDCTKATFYQGAAGNQAADWTNRATQTYTTAENINF